MYYVYNLKCQDGFYTGCTDNLKDRIDRHQKWNYFKLTKNILKYDKMRSKYKFFKNKYDKYKIFFQAYIKK